MHTASQRRTPDLPAPVIDTQAQLAALADRFVAAERGPIRLVTLAGGGIEGLAARLPPQSRARIDEAVRLALAAAYGAASLSHTRRAGGDRAHRRAVAMLGALGGLGGLPSALAELPVTTATILRSIQEIAREHGEDTSIESTRLACLQVLGTGGPLARDDGADLAFLGARLTLTGSAVQGLIASIAPRFATTVLQRIATRSIPAIGAATGAAVNLAFMRYYQDMAHVHFGLRRMVRHGALHAPAAFGTEVAARRARRIR